jgi:hypothetical protein
MIKLQFYELHDNYCSYKTHFLESFLKAPSYKGYGDWVIVDKYSNYVRKCMWQLYGWDRVDICMTFHIRAFDFFNNIALSKKCQLYPTHTVAT